MATLWDALKGFRPVTLDDFVPPAVPPLATIVHHGTNSLPVASHFQKRFCRPAQSCGPAERRRAHWTQSPRPLSADGARLLRRARVH